MPDSPFKGYDSEFIEAVSQRWYDLLDSLNYEGNEKGEVVIAFQLHSDGRVSDFKTLETSMDEPFSRLCIKAVADPAPYSPWPEDMRRMVEDEVRHLTFTFHYN